MTGFAVWPTPAGLLLFSTVMGFGHIMLMASQQMICVRAAGPKSLEAVFGNFMVVTAIGQGVGPYIVGFMGGSAPIPPTQSLFVVAACCAAAALLFCLLMKPARNASAAKDETDVVPIAQILRIPGLVPVIVAGVILVAASDTVVVYIPLLGAERRIDVHDIGLLLTVRAGASMLARLFYARMVAAFGRWPLMIAGTFVCALSYAAIAAPIPLWAMHVAIRHDGLLVRAGHHIEHHHRGRHDHGERARHDQLAAHHEQPHRPVRHAVRRGPDRRSGRPRRPVPHSGRRNCDRRRFDGVEASCLDNVRA